VSGFLSQAAASAERNAAKWRKEYPSSRLDPLPGEPRERPFFLPGDGAAFGLVAEVKRRSPSRGEVMPPGLDPAALARLYLTAGAEAISVVVEEEHFGGSPAMFAAVAAAVPLPLLWKDFVVDAHQVELASALGASAVLLLADLLPGGELARMMALARARRLRPLVEVHDEAQAERALAAGADLVGVNHRDLRTLAMDMTLTERLAPLLSRVTAVAESGLSRPEESARMRSLGYRAVLVGTALASSADPAGAAGALLGKGAP
jgi:indole-3-glycerol phosphate synthase